MKRLVWAATAAALAMGISAPAQAANGDELRGQTVDVRFADGTTNSVFFGSTGMARITNGAGQSANANWFVRGDQLCLRAGANTECWGYANTFAARAPVSMTSSCGAPSVWTPRNVNAPRQQAAPILGERG